MSAIPISLILPASGYAYFPVNDHFIYGKDVISSLKQHRRTLFLPSGISPWSKGVCLLNELLRIRVDLFFFNLAVLKGRAQNIFLLKKAVFV